MPEPWYGLHERLLTAALQQAIEDAGVDQQADIAKLSHELTAPALGAHLSRVFSGLITDLPRKDRENWEAAIQRLDAALHVAEHPFAQLARELPLLPLRELREVQTPKAAALGQQRPPRPDLPLALSALLTGSARTPSLVSQLEKEMASADRVDWLVSFIKWSGIRPLREALRRFTDGAGGDGLLLRVATTSYLGATDLKAVQFLLELPRTEVRVSYDTHRTRLHAKAFLFHRETGFGSAYVGSANVSRVALDEGLEWTTKISQHELPYLWRQIQASFETHWEDDEEFEVLDREGLERLGDALTQESRRGSGAGQGTGSEGDTVFVPFELRPYTFQKEILEAIQAERRAGLGKHLVIAATGTGKTMVAAFDYQRLIREDPTRRRPSLLFLAHREEILRQALTSFRQVLKDGSFGDLLVSGSRLSQDRHLFATVQSWHSRELNALPPDHFDYVVLDEAHHAQARTYQAILDHLKPTTLLGLTATPERADGKDIRDDFADDRGANAAFTHELRLPDAVERGLLCPFHYFGVGDAEGVDLSRLRWERGGYRTSDLENVLGANEARARWVRDQFQEYATDPDRVRGLGFCVSQAHAHFMARQFNAWGLPSVALTAESSKSERRAVQSRLVQREIRFIFTVDLYNEGVDIPQVDTVLLLRPTESLTVYLQQLGRGLRLHDEKPHLTVLDFIAPQHRSFRFAERFRALTRDPSRRIDRQIEEGFPWLPSGCLIQLDRRASETVLDNIRQTVGMRKDWIVTELGRLRRTAGDRPALEAILDHLHLDDPDDLLRRGLPSRLLEAAGAPPRSPGIEAYETGLVRGLRELAAADDRSVLLRLREALENPEAAEESDIRLELAHSLLWGANRPGAGTLRAVHRFVVEREGIRRDILEVVNYRLRHLRPGSDQSFSDHTGPLKLHGHYTREQILLALGVGSFADPRLHREGVAHVKDRKVDAFLVTIQKSEARFSPTTMYEDYALSDRVFHWQSQSTTSATSETGKRYIHHQRLGYRPMLFARESATRPNGLTAPFVFLGPLTYMKHDGGRPMSITWRLEHPMPARVVRWSREAV
ncbi:MAG: DUF3427 domain-containing protein [Gemmatimonadota bacterium]